MALLSIIVPVYNVAPYLEEGLNSLLKQDLRDIEIICVDDKSTDNSLQILQKYSSLDNRLILIQHNQNKGLSATRNTGIKNAKGKYIAFFDPDDSVESNMYSSMIRRMEEDSCDIIMCGFRTFPDNHTVIPNFPTEPCSPYDFIRQNKKIHSSNDLCFSWRFLFKRQFLTEKKLSFIEEIRYAEDMVFNFNALMQANRVTMLPQPLYNYRVNNPTSIMKQKYNPFMEDGLERQVKEKRRIISTYRVDSYTPITMDMSEDIIKRFTTMLFNNLWNNSQEVDKKKGVKRIINMPMIRKASQVVGFRNIYPSWKEYMFYLAIKFRISSLVYKLYFKS
ncbi:glycosyltransferase family 2 protein [uncultured Bacteroides sp.]|uniref:glycosyltransferase family 2 protein n=1 Tax=uncultured Bacteroides sp. TaxID=162156 RepID=UPI00260D2279|nr:glycosyltransferase family 2 protein [uncultured Bacteroides sp.]